MDFILLHLSSRISELQNPGYPSVLETDTSVICKPEVRVWIAFLYYRVLFIHHTGAIVLMYTVCLLSFISFEIILVSNQQMKNLMVAHSRNQ